MKALQWELADVKLSDVKSFNDAAQRIHSSWEVAAALFHELALSQAVTRAEAKAHHFLQSKFEIRELVDDLRGSYAYLSSLPSPRSQRMEFNESMTIYPDLIAMKACSCDFYIDYLDEPTSGTVGREFRSKQSTPSPARPRTSAPPRTATADEQARLVSVSSLQRDELQDILQRRLAASLRT